MKHFTGVLDFILLLFSFIFCYLFSDWCNSEDLTLAEQVCQCCYDIVRMLVDTNPLGLIESSSIDRDRQKRRLPMPFAFVFILNSAVIWNVPAVYCIQKLLPFPIPILAFAPSEEELWKWRPQTVGGQLEAPGRNVKDRN